MNPFVPSFVREFLHVCVCERERDGRSLGDIINPFVETGTVTSEHVSDESEC